MTIAVRSSIATVLFLAVSMLVAQDAPKFRTDADGPVTGSQVKKARKSKGKGTGGSLEWYQLVDGKFPPPGSAHAISGELIHVDHLERRFHLRIDRNDSQDRGVWDLAVDAVMLPYGSIYYHGAPAALQDVPLGTHLHGLFYLRPAGETTLLPPANNNRRTAECDFRRCFQLEDDFTHHARQKQLWKIDSADLSAKKLVAALQGESGAIGKLQTFDLTSSSRVYEKNGFGTLGSLSRGQLVLFNLTWATLYGPGRIQEIWLDEASRQLASAQQLDRHRDHVRERGLAGWVDVVDNEAEIVTVTFFGGVDRKLFDELGQTGAAATRCSLAVARDSLMTYDPGSDRKGGSVLEIKKVPMEPGSSGVQVRVKCEMLLEGFRPGRIVRLYPAAWKVIGLPHEEKYFGRE
jgi:hypothetical protein